MTCMSVEGSYIANKSRMNCIRLVKIILLSGQTVCAKRYTNSLSFDWLTVGGISLIMFIIQDYIMKQDK